jgi:DNA-binding CsgD family transcriptional regulator
VDEVRDQDGARGSEPRAGFVGRAHELATVSAAANEAAAGRPRVIAVEGAAGVGKTTFLERVLDLLDATWTVLVVHADEHQRDVPMGVLEQLVPAPPAAPFPAGLALLATLAERGRAGPVALVIEDLHVADVPSSQALLVTIRRLDQDPVLVVVTSRENELDRDAGWARLLADGDRCTTVGLGAFTAAECAERAAAEGITLDRRSAERLHRHTAGHPLYVQMLLAELEPEELVKPGPLRVPRSMSTTTLAMVTALPPASRVLAEALAVLGGTTLLALGRVTGVDDPTGALDHLLATGLVEWSPHEASKPVRFAHPLHAAAVYDELSPARRRELHRAAIDVVGPDRALGHRVAAATGPDPELVADLEAAAAPAMTGRRLASAAQFLLWAADLSATPADRDQRLLRAVRLEIEAGELRSAQARRPAVEMCAAGAERSLVLGLLDVRTGALARAETHLTDAVRLAGEAPAIAAEAYLQLAQLRTSLVDSGGAVAAAAAALDLGVLSGPPAHAACVLLAIGTSQREGAEQGLAVLDGRCPAGELDTDETTALVAGTRGMFEHYAGHSAAAAHDLRRALALGHGAPLGVHLPRVHVLLARALYDLGHWDEALVQAGTGLSLAVDDDQAIIVAQAHAAIGTIHAGRGAGSDADDHLDRAGRALAAVPSPESALWTCLGHAARYQARAEPARVVEALQPLHRGPTDRGLPAFALTWWPRLIEALLDLGDTDAARGYLDRLSATSPGAGPLIRHRARLLALTGDVAGATAQFRLAVGADADRDHALDRALAHHQAGCHLLTNRRRREGIEQLQAAREVLARLGAAPYVARVDADLVAAGARPDGPVTADALEVLSEREREVAILVASGCSNREAAEALYLSVKSIEYHLGKAYGKLGVRSRRQLRTLVSAGARA